MNTKKVIELQNKVFSELKNLWEICEQWEKLNLILDNFLDELEIKKNKETRFIAFSRISELRVEPLELYLDEMTNKIEINNKKLGLRLPNKLENKQKILDKAYNYVKRIYEDLQEKFVYELEESRDVPLVHLYIISDFELEIFKGTLAVWKAFNNFMPVWQNAILKQNNILDNMFWNNSEKIMQFLKNKKLLDTDENWNFTDRCYSVLIAGKSRSYFEAFPKEVWTIIFALEDFIEKVNCRDNSWIISTDAQNYINYLTAIKNAFAEKEIVKLLWKWQEVDKAWMEIKWSMQISHPLEFYEDKYRKAVAPEWDLRILDSETLESKVESNIKNMYEIIYDNNSRDVWQKHLNLREKYSESYNFSKENINKSQLYISEPVLYFGSELNGMFSAQVVPNDEIVSAEFWKKIFAFPKMVLEDRKKTPIMKLTKEVLDEDLLNNFWDIIKDDELFYEIYDVETIWHEFWHTLFNTKDNEQIMNSKTWNFKNIEEFKATTGWLVSYFMAPYPSLSPKGRKEQKEFEEKLIIMHLVRCIWLLKYREIVDVLPYYNEVLIHLDILLESKTIKIINNKILLNFSEKTYSNLKINYIKHYKKLINIYLEKIDAWEFLFDYVIVDENWNNISKNLELRKFGEYYYDLYKKIGNEVAE